jgi:hypothetical protein
MPEPVCLAELAALAGMSRFHLVRSFRTAYGETPIRYLNRRRIERAQDLLRTRQPHGHRDLHGGRLLQSRLVLVAVHRAGRGEPGGLPEPVGRGRRAHVAGCHLFMYGVIPQFRRSQPEITDRSVEA